MNSDNNNNNNNNNNVEISCELNVDISCQSCIDSINEQLEKKLKNTKMVEHNIAEQRIILKGTDLTQDILETIKGSGRNAAICGLSSSNIDGEEKPSCHKKQQQQQQQESFTPGSAVCSLGLIEGWEKGCGGSGGIGSKGVYGIIRLLKASATKTLFEGRVTGLKPGKHSLVVHELGNLTNGCDSVGEPYISNQNNNNNSDNNEINKCKEIINKIIGTSMVQQDGKAEFRILSDKYEFWDLIGRSIVLHSQDSKYLPNNHVIDTNQNNGESDKIIGERVACGIISRAASVGENHKKICPCDNTKAI